MSGPIRNILGQVRNRIDVPYIMDHRKILIANLSKGMLGEDKANLLGAFARDPIPAGGNGAGGGARSTENGFSLDRR